MENRLISIMIFLPLLGAVAQAMFSPTRGRGGLSRTVALIASLGSSAAAVFILASLQSNTPGVQLGETVSWIGSYSINYDLGVDGLNVLLLLLISVVFPILIAQEWNRKPGVRGIHGLFLLLQTALLGAVCAQDMFLQFFFWSLSAIPLYFLIGIWGSEHRERAALHTFVSSSIGNALLFAALVLIYYSADPHSFSLRELAGGKLEGKTFEILGMQCSVPVTAFLLIAGGLALRVPIWPFNGWFTQVAVEAPSSVFVALSAAIVPVGIYIFLKLTYSLFPGTIAAHSSPIMIVGMVNLMLGALCALAQRNLKLLPSFICLSEVGFILVGAGSLSSPGLVGAFYQQLVLGLGVAGFGLMAGLLTERAGASNTDAPAFGGIITRAPIMAMVCGMMIASLLGLPGAGGFVSHALMVLGSYSIFPVAVLLAGLAVAISTYTLFTMYRRVFFGKEGEAAASFSDLSLREKAYLLPLVAALLFCGVYPMPLLEIVRPTVLSLLATVKAP